MSPGSSPSRHILAVLAWEQEASGVYRTRHSRIHQGIRCSSVVGMMYGLVFTTGTSSSMAISRTCSKHPDRMAIGVCVVTRQPICSECSTRYQGINYSAEGLAQLLAQEKRQREQSGRSRVWVGYLAFLCAPLLLWLVYLEFSSVGQWLIDLIQQAREL